MLDFLTRSRLPITNRGKPASDHFRVADHPPRTIVAALKTILFVVTADPMRILPTGTLETKSKLLSQSKSGELTYGPSPDCLCVIGCRDAGEVAWSRVAER